ncbi:hypothetical protein I4U23_009899 [Adineta vaga]|nr:hypothetical protein I4U23_009899 [Adineta vaga]
MVSLTKAASDTHLHHHKTTSLSIPLELLPPEKSHNISKYRSGNNILSRKRLYNYSVQQSGESINTNYQKFSNNQLVTTHFPIANIPQDSILLRQRSSTIQFPTVPSQAGTFIHRLVNKFFSITNINQKKKTLSRLKRKNKRNLSDDSLTCIHLSSTRKQQRRRQKQRPKLISNKNDCTICRKYRNCFSILSQDLCESPMILNSNATTTTIPCMSISKYPLEKKRTLNDAQCQIITSAIELIFDTLISNYQ